MGVFSIRRPIVAIVIAILTVIVWRRGSRCAFCQSHSFRTLPAGNLVCNELPRADAKTLEQVCRYADRTASDRRVYNMEYMYSVNTTNVRKPLCSSILISD